MCLNISLADQIEVTRRGFKEKGREKEKREEGREREAVCVGGQNGFQPSNWQPVSGIVCFGSVQKENKG